MTLPDATLRFEADHTALLLAGDTAAATPVRLAVSPQALARRLWPQGHPGPGPLERAIDEIETAIEASPLRHAPRGRLLLAPGTVHGLPPRPTTAGLWTRDEVEARFNALVASAAGMTGDQAAALVLLRELLHHGGFTSLQVHD